MALFSTYTKPGVYTTVVYTDAGVSVFGSARIPVLIGEGLEFTTVSNQELHRGSSNVADEQQVLEDLSAQIDGVTRTFETTYSPVVTGDGTGTVTNNVQYLQAFTVDTEGSLIPLIVTSVKGSTGKFQLANILRPGVDQLKVSYFFKRVDTRVVNEDLSYQIPATASWVPTQSTGGGEGQPPVLTPIPTGLTLTTAVPGNVGNKVSLAFTLAAVGLGVVDALAVSGIGTDTLSIELRKVDGSQRSVQDVLNLFAAGVQTKSAGDIVAAFNPAGSFALTSQALPFASTAFSGGAGQNTNTTFTVANLPIVDGTNGGVVTNSPSIGNFVVTVNGQAATVTALVGSKGQFTLAAPVTPGQKLLVSYYTNTYQNTFDILPASGITKITSLGFAPGQNNFTEGVDFVLANDAIHWGNVAVGSQGVSTPGYAPFDGVVVNTSLKDEQVFLVQVGVGDGMTTTFTLPDAPTDGSNTGKVTNNPAQIAVFASPSSDDVNPADALAAGGLRVINLNGKAKTFQLYTPPALGCLVFANYFRNILPTNTYTLSVLSAGSTPGSGTYNVKDQNGKVVPSFSLGANHVADAEFQSVGIVWPFGESDMQGVAGATPTETLTLTFMDDGLTLPGNPPVQATCSTVQPGLIFTATTAGPAANASTIMFSGTTPTTDAAAVTVSGEAITVNILKAGATVTTRTLADIISLFSALPGFTTPNLGKVLCAAANPQVDTSTLCGTNGANIGVAVLFHGGANAVSGRSYADRYTVSSNRTQAQQTADGLGATNGTGYLGQTFMDWHTGVHFTLVDPAQALSYGLTTLPPSYLFTPGDILTIVIDATTGAFQVGGLPVDAIPGVDLTVQSTYGMALGDTYIVKTYDNAGNAPAIGEFYYASYTVDKTAAEMGYHNYSNLADVVKAYGPVSPDNRISLAAQLFFQNGGSALGVYQVPKQAGMDVASDQDYMTALGQFTMPLPGTDRKANVFIPLSTSPVVQQFLAKQLTIQASPRMRGEAVAFMGLPTTATPDSAILMAQGLNSERCRLIWPGMALLSLVSNGVSVQYSVDGSFVAAAVAGLALSANNDVASTLTTQAVVGFDSLGAPTPETTLDQMASNGILVMVEVPGALEVRHDVTTSTNGVLMSEPYTTTQIDNLRQKMRATLKQFVGQKNVQAVLTNVQIAANGVLSSLTSQGLLGNYKAPVVSSDPNDPTVVNVTATVQPVFSILWISVTFNVTTTGN